jgi:hypothetical protein
MVRLRGAFPVNPGPRDGNDGVMAEACTDAELIAQAGDRPAGREGGSAASG